MAIENGVKATIPTVDAKGATPDALADDVIQGLKIAGACIIKNLYSQDTIDNTGNMTYFQKNVVTATGLAGKSETYALEVIGNPMWTKVRDYFLTYSKGTFWVGNNQGTHETSAQLGSATCLELRPGAEAQGLHRDDLVHQGFNTEDKEYVLGRDKSLTFFVACNRTHKANGATRIVPGSHLWDYTRPPPAADDKTSIVDAEVERGDGVIILGSVYHGGGANTTENEHRLVLTCGVTCSLRQEENQYLANDVKRILRYPLPIQRFIGYGSFPPGVGLVNWDDPIKIINPTFKEPEPATA
ncbi:hypothetical protein N7470_007707 [Penicillium chermesinum]|nr:hypothetical protein N7470_007707 [Penicillium chermesinum]